MIERFNFYDVYAYFLPGVALVALLSLPFLLASGVPDVAWEAVLVGIPLIYFAGHVLQQLGRMTFGLERQPKMNLRRLLRRALNSLLQRKGTDTPPEQQARTPSDIILDTGDSSLDESIRRVVIAHAEDLGIAVAEEDLDRRKQARYDLFLILRSRLVQAGSAAYVEQYQAMYALMLGLSVAATLAASFALGLLLPLGLTTYSSASLPSWLVSLFACLALLLLLLLLCCSPKRRLSLWCVGVVVTIAGLIVGEAGYELPDPGPLAGIMLVNLYLARNFHGAFRHFTWTFAKAVYRDAAALLTSPH